MIVRTWRGRAVGIDRPIAARVVREGSYVRGMTLAGGAIELSERGEPEQAVSVVGLRPVPTFEDGDVLLVSPEGSVELLFRVGWRHNFMLITRRCDSLCVMCSQPPVSRDDSARVESLIEAVPLIPDGEGDIGLTGGEPALLGSRLVRLVSTLRDAVPSRPVHLLSNGRRFQDAALADELGAVQHPDLMVGVPLYADHAALHDEIVGAKGAFVETMMGIENLARARVPVEIRVVLHAMTLPRLEKLALFIYRNLPYASQIVLMGLEPTGWAIRNMARLWVEPRDVGAALPAAREILRARGLRVRVYNLPLCALPREVWDAADASISEWKNEFVSECEGCTVRRRCAGFFSSALAKSRPIAVQPITTTNI